MFVKIIFKKDFTTQVKCGTWKNVQQFFPILKNLKK